MADPTGESKSEVLRLDFDRRLMLQFRGSLITSDGGLLAYREFDDVLALTESGGENWPEARRDAEVAAVISDRTPGGGSVFFLCNYPGPAGWMTRGSRHPQVCQQAYRVGGQGLQNIPTLLFCR